MTKKITLSLTLLLTSTLFADDMQIKKEGIGYIKLLGKTLKSNLISHIKHDSTGLEAMGFCTTQASKLTQKVNAELPKGVSVRRTALKLRNENNTADATDTKIMQAYQDAEKAGKLFPTDVKVVSLEKTNRVYKPLLVGKACMKCHGKSDAMSKDLRETIQTAYPKDKAIDFKIGDFRGVIVAEMLKK